MNAAQWLLSLSSLLSGTAAQHMQSVQIGGLSEVIYSTVLSVSTSEPVITCTQKPPVEKPTNTKKTTSAYALTSVDILYVTSRANRLILLQVKQ